MKRISILVLVGLFGLMTVLAQENSMEKGQVQLSEEEIERLSAMEGHLKPLGSVGPYFELYEMEGFPTPRDFFNKFVIPSTPLVMKNAAKLSPAFTKWSDEYFINHPLSAKSQIFAEGRKKEIRTEPGFQMSFKRFVETYNETEIYMVNGVPKHLREDVLMPPPLLCEPVIAAILDYVTWFSSGGTKSVLHNDDVDNINCLFRGNKTLVFINPHDGEEIGQSLIDRSEGGYSSMDVDAVDYTKFPILANVRYARVDMKAGDCLFIPYKWFHQVNSFGSNLAVNLWWSHLPHKFIDLTDEICGDFTNRRTLADFTYSSMEEPEEVESNEEGAVEEEEAAEESNVYKPLEEQEGVKIIDTNSATQPVEDPAANSLIDKVFAAIKRVKKPVNMKGLKKWILTKFPETFHTWSDRCQEILMQFYGTLDQNKDTIVDENDAKLFFAVSDHTLEQLRDVSAFFQEDLGRALQEATTKQEEELVQKLLDRGEIDREQIANIFGDKLIMQGMKRDEL